MYAAQPQLIKLIIAIVGLRPVALVEGFLPLLKQDVFTVTWELLATQHTVLSNYLFKQKPVAIAALLAIPTLRQPKPVFQPVPIKRNVI
jgi:hypothetical protein